MKTRAAVLWDRNQDWSVEEIELDPPKAGEVLVAVGGSGVCHSDEHLVTGDLTTAVPIIGGHEGAGIIMEVGPGVTGLAPQDRVIFSFVPCCGQCRACACGMGSLCELGMYMREGRQVSDHTARHHARGQDLGLMCLLGTFAEHTVVSQASCVKIEDDLPLDLACLLGCGVITGWGAVTCTGEARAGDVVVIVGVGGVAMSTADRQARRQAGHVSRRIARQRGLCRRRGGAGADDEGGGEFDPLLLRRLAAGQGNGHGGGGGGHLGERLADGGERGAGPLRQRQVIEADDA